jgi:hypothetical protein
VNQLDREMKKQRNKDKILELMSSWVSTTTRAYKNLRNETGGVENPPLACLIEKGNRRIKCMGSLRRTPRFYQCMFEKNDKYE